MKKKQKKIIRIKAPVNNRRAYRNIAKKEKASFLPKPETVKASNSAPGKLVQEIHDALKAGNIDPLLRQSLLFAIGDVVGLGFMTQEELDAEATFNCDGDPEQKSGQERALEFVPAYIRAQMLKEITPYYLAKKKEVNDNGIKDENLKVTLYIPDNGRDKNK